MYIQIVFENNYNQIKRENSLKICLFQLHCIYYFLINIPPYYIFLMFLIMESIIIYMNDSKYSEYNLQDIFPVQHKNTSTAITPHSYIGLLRDYIDALDTSKHILLPNDDQIIINQSRLIKKYLFVFKGEYGSVLLFSREKPFLPTSVGILYFNRLNINAFTDGNNCVQFVEDPQEVGYYQLQQMPHSEESLDKEVQAFKLVMKQCEAKMSKRQQEEKTPFYLKKIVELAMKQLLNVELEKQQKQKKEGKNEKEKELSVEIVKQNTINFHNIRFPEINHQFCFLIYSFLCGNQKVVRVFLFSFKLHILYTQLSKQTQVSPDTLKRCLNSLIQQYKRLCNMMIEHDSQAAIAIINQISREIEKRIEVDQGRVKNISNVVLAQSLRTQSQFQKPQSIKRIIEYGMFFPPKLTNANDIGFIQNLSISEATPFTDLDNLYSTLKYLQNGEYYWILLVQRCFFSLACSFDCILISSAEIQIQFKDKFSKMHIVVNRYEQIMTNVELNRQYNLKLKNQAYSHVYLIKYIAAIIAFELFKVSQIKYKRAFPIQDYTIRFPVENLYRDFTSTRYQARVAIQNVENYMNSNSSKTVLFNLSQKNKELAKLAMVYAADIALNKSYVTTKQNALQANINKLNVSFTAYKQRYSHNLNEVSLWENRNCSCSQEKPKMKSLYTPLIQIKCNRCQQHDSAKVLLESIKKQQFYTIVADAPKDEDQLCLFAFFESANKQCGGAMKMIFEAMVPIVKKEAFYLGSNSMNSLHPLYPYSKKTYNSRRPYYDNIIIGKCEASQFVIYNDPLSIYYYNYSSIQPIDLKFLKPQDNPSYAKLQWIIDKTSTDNRSREHLIYANLDQKQVSHIKEFSHITMEQFKEYASIRTNPRTQLIILAQAILSRHASPATLKLHEFQRLVLMNACGNISAYRDYKNNTTILDKTRPSLEQVLPIVSQSICQLLTSYLEQWKFNDLYSLQIIGPILSLLCKLVRMPETVVRIASRALEQYQVLRGKDNKQTTDSKLRELYILHSIMCCFTQNICDGSGQACVIFSKIMVNYRLLKRFMSHQFLSKKDYVVNVKSYKHYFNLAVVNNIQSVVSFFSAQPEHIIDVINQIDKDVGKESQWKLVKEKNYVFKGESSGNIYEINLFEGIFVKNGVEASKLPERIRTDPHYIDIFGKFTDLQVLQQANGSIRTRSDFQHYFPQQKGAHVFFQFCLTAEKETQIKLIFKRGTEVRSFLLIPHKVLGTESLYVPLIYMKHYQCWLDENNHHLIFRKRKLADMNKIGLILIRNSSQPSISSFNIGQQESNDTETNIVSVNQGRIISKQFQDEPLSYLLKEDHQSFFQQLVITDRQHWHNAAIDILSTIESQQYIIQTLSSGENRRTIFWLHRCDLKFIFDEKKGLISQNFQGYYIHPDYCHHQLLPWKRSDNVKCLILHKYENSFRSATLHQYMLLLSNQNVNKSGIILITAGEITNKNIFSYEMHDTFMDIRSKSRSNQIHLACLIASLSHMTYFKPLMMTNEQYCISLIRSCYGNLPLNELECAKINNLISLCVQLNLNTLLLCCYVLCTVTNSLKQVLAFENQSPCYEDQVMPYLGKKQQLMKTCKFIYRKQFEGQMISPHRRLNDLELHLLGIRKNQLDEILAQEKLTQWFHQQSYIPQYDEKTMKGLETTSQSYHKTQKDIEHLKEMILKFCQKDQDAQEPEKEFRLHLQSSDTLAKEMLDDLESSYKSYLSYNQKYEKLQLTKEDSVRNLVKYFTLPKQKCEKFKKDIQKYLDKMHEKAQQHLDIISGYRPIITVKSYTELLCRPSLIYDFYPKIKKEFAEIILKAIKVWILLTLEIQSLHRILIILGERPIDKIALFRELESPRVEINSKNYWICFEAEMKIRIWSSQYDTYKHLRNSDSGAVSQLNMGEGKTQVIIPMIVLDNIYDPLHGRPISRINILSQLFQEAQGNYFRFFSVTSFRIPIFSLYFNREVGLSLKNINLLKYMLYILQEKMLMLLDRESCLSMILKIRQEVLNDQNGENSIGHYRDEWLFADTNVFDIFDEVDALMTCKKSFVYSIGASSELPDSRLRFQLARVILEIVCVELMDWLLEQKMAVIEETYEKAMQSVKQGGFPKGLRLKKDNNPQKLKQFRRQIVEYLLNHGRYCPPQFQFYDNLSKKSKEVLITYLIDETTDNLSTIKHQLPKEVNQILAVRGLIAFRVLQHCLTMRNGVDFGVPGESHPKRLGVPYQAGDVPSKRSEFSHPDVAILVSYISYFSKGITREQFSDCIHLLMKRSESVKRYNYSQWYNSIFNFSFRPTGVSEFKQINVDSTVQLDQLHDVYQFNRNTIIFWLINIVFVNDLRQYEKSITSSAWDIAYVKRSIGYSGTKDTRWLFPNYLKWSPSNNDAINGTDGKMIHLMLNNTCGILTVKDGKESLWERFCQHVLEIDDDKVGCIIDAGAILVGKSFEKEIVPWIVKNPLFRKDKFRGVTFCDETGKWKVFDTITLSIVQRGTSIPEDQTLVIFDQARTRGADIKMNSHVRAALSLSPNMTKDKFMQAVGRLRKFGRHQKIYILGTGEAFQKIRGLEQVLEPKKRVEKVIEWVCENSIKDNRHMQYTYSRLAQIHYKTVLQRYPDVQVFDPSLKSLYSGKITEKSVFEIYKISMCAKLTEDHQNSPEVQTLTAKMSAYAKDYRMMCYDFEDVCEREVEFIVENDKILENEYEQLFPVEESNNIEIYEGSLSTLSYRFDKHIKFSKNFVSCTHKKGLGGFSIKSLQNNELCNINFFLWNKSQLVFITQREMALQLSNGTPNFGCFSLREITQLDARFVGRFRDLSSFTPLVNEKQLHTALIHAQFFNGIEVFDNEGRKILVDLIKSSLKTGDKHNQSIFSSNSFLSSIAPVSSHSLRYSLLGALNSSQIKISKQETEALGSDDIEEMVSHFLSRRRTLHSKFINSDLEKVMVQLRNIPQNELRKI